MLKLDENLVYFKSDEANNDDWIRNLAYKSIFKLLNEFLELFTKILNKFVDKCIKYWYKIYIFQKKIYQLYAL